MKYTVISKKKLYTKKHLKKAQEFVMLLSCNDFVLTSEQIIEFFDYVIDDSDIYNWMVNICEDEPIGFTSKREARLELNNQINKHFKCIFTCHNTENNQWFFEKRTY